MINKARESLKELRENGAVSFAYGTITFTYLAFVQRADIIKQALDQAKKNEEMLNVLKKVCKGANIGKYEDLDENEQKELTETEFNLIKEWLEK